MQKDEYSGPHLKRYEGWFHFVDTRKDQRITGDDAKVLFARAGLPQPVLKKVWALSDVQRRGYLDLHNFCRAMDLISLAQNGRDVTPENYAQFKDTIVPPAMKGLDRDVGSNDGSENPFDDEKPKDEAASPAKAAASSWSLFGPKREPMPKKVITGVVDGLKELYFNQLKPLEESYRFAEFFSPLLTPSDFDAKPSVLMLGQYSTGKTTFIKYLLGKSYPGANVGPEPTTDRFTVVMHGHEERRIPGNTLAVSPDHPYQSLQAFGTGFLARLEAAQCPCALLESISLIDTPGVLSGEKQRIERAYNFIQVCQWFASRTDLILLLFDPHKLDISDEFKEVITAMRGHEEKVRIVLNKSDTVDQQQLMRVYGALMWSLGKVFKNPEVCRVYVGSFNSEHKIRTDVNPNGAPLFEAEQADLMLDLYDIPKRSCDRKINELVKRVRALKVHLLIMQYLKKQMPALMFKQSSQAKLLEELPGHFETIKLQNHLSVGDFPHPQAFGNILRAFELDKFPKVTEKMLKTVDDALTVEIPLLIKKFSNPY